MADGAGVRETTADGGGGGRCCTPRRWCTPNESPPMGLLPQELDLLLSKYVLFHMYLLKAVTGVGYLALTWSTVVLLGGFITALTKKDFWCITVISFMQAARIFHDLADQLLPNFFKLVTKIIRHNCDVVRYRMWLVTESLQRKHRPAKVAKNVGSVSFVLLAVLPFLVLSYIPAFLYVYGGPVACIALAIWRTVQRDYDDGGDSSGKANLAPALDMFYALVLLQGGLLLVWLYHDCWWVDHLITLREECELPNTEWCRLSLVEFLCDTRARCWRDLSSIRGRKLVHYAAGLLDSGSWVDNLSGARLLQHFIGLEHRRQESSAKKPEPTVRSLLLPSRSKIQKLIDALGWRAGRRPEDAEMRKLAVRIVAHLAGDLHLAQFPGAIQCISYLLQEEATTAYINQQGLTRRPPQRRLASEKQTMLLRLKKREARHQRRHETEQEVVDGGVCNELILQGLAILERLASDRDNCSEICGSPGLVDMITAPLYSGTFVHDIGSIADWVHIANATFKVVYQLIHAPGESSARLRSEIAENEQAMSNLDTIVRQETQQEQAMSNLDAIVRQKALQELKMLAMEILTELALHSSINLPSEKKETLMKTSFDRLVQFLDNKDIKLIKYRIKAAEILEKMCAHYDKQRVKDILLPKVLSEIMSSERENAQRDKGGNKMTHAPRQDEESQIPAQEVNTQIKATPSRGQNKSSLQGNDEDQTAIKALQENLLSLTLQVMYDNPEIADLSNALRNNGSAFVARLKTLVKENCEATVVSLNIVKLSGQIAVLMMERNRQYTEYFKIQEFVKTLSEAKQIMSNLESCVLFAGRDHGVRNMARPLLLDLEKEAQRLVG